MAPKRAAAAAAADPSSSTEEDGDTSSSDSATSHEQEVADDEMEEVADEERGKKELEEEEPESESEEGEQEPESEKEEWAAAADVEEDEESTEEGDEEEEAEEEEVDFQPIRRIDPPLTAELKEEEDVDFQPIKRIDHCAPSLPAEAGETAAAKNHQPQSNKSPARDRKRASGEISKSSEPKSRRIRRVWAPEDEVLILASLAQHRRQLGGLPAWGNSDFFESIRERLEDNSCHRTDVKDKARSLLRRYKSGVVSTTDHDRRLHKLSKDVWGDLLSIGGSINGKKQADGAAFAVSGAENGGRQSDTTSTKDFKGMCEMYPLLAHEVKLLAEVQPGLESSFTRLDAKRALDIEKKLERIKYAELKIGTQMVLEVHAPKAKIKKKLVSLLEKVSKNV